MATSTQNRIALKERCMRDRLAQRQTGLTREQLAVAIKIAVTDAAADAIMLAKSAIRGHSASYFRRGGDSAAGVAILESLEAIDVQRIIQTCITLQTLSKEEI